MRRQGTTVAAIAAIALAATTAVPASAAPTPDPYRANDFGGFNAILPPGTNGLDNGIQLANFLTTGARPPHNNDQYAPYENLVYAPRGLTAAQIPSYYHDASFGVASGQVERTYSPRDDVTIQRDQLGVPHVYGSSRSGAMFGLGYVGAEDRLFFMDALRHAGRAQLSSFAGGAEGNREMDESVWADTPYTEQDLQRQCEYRPKGFEALTDQLRSDLSNYLAGINEYIAEARLDPSMMPGEYAAINQPQGPDDFTCPDVIATASLIGGIFGKGGGRELDSALVLEQAQKRFGPRAGFRVWHDFRNAEDPEAPTTVHKKRFPYEVPPKHVRGRALPDPGSVDKAHVVTRSTAPSSRSGARPEGMLAPLAQLYDGGPLRAGASNALLVSARQSQGGKPVAVMGPQVAYFAPQILMEEDVHAPGIDARGAAFPGVNLFVQLGRGRDYSWSATSAGQDLIDTFAVPLCDPNGGKASIDSSGYRFRGQCLPFEVLTRTNSWFPSPADQTPPGSETLTTLRSKMGIVIARARLHGRPVAYTKLRDTYFHEADSALGFMSFNNPAAMNGPRDFQRAASLINYTFNWFYADDKNIAYYNSGWNPRRAKRTDPNLPVKSKFEWRGFQADSLAGATPYPVKLTGFAAHPHVINQNFLTSWNNKQAHGYRAADENWSYGPTYRSVTLDERVRRLIKGKRKASLPELIEAMKEASTVDLRGHTVLPYALRIIKSKPIPAGLRNAVSKLSKWAKSGAHRIDRDRSGSYDHSDAIRIMDAWWEPLLHAEFERSLGGKLFDAIADINILDDTPNLHLGSAYNGGWYVYANKDLRSLLAKAGKGRPVRGRDSRIYCGRGKLGRCRAALLGTLQSALGDDPYGENADCNLNDRQMCFDAIKFRSTGGITQPDMTWMNRPTFQQAVQIQGHR
jgi:acyl-homoserine lactone acylase PvdQ